MNWNEATPPNAPLEEPAGPTVDTDVRARLLTRFEQWLDEALAEEAPPEGVASEILAQLERDEDAVTVGEDCSLHALWSAVTALTQEIKLEGRAFKQLDDTLAPLAAEIPAAREVQEKAIEQTQRLTESVQGEREERGREVAREAERRVRVETVELLLDIRERMARGLDAVQSYTKRVRATLSTGRQYAPIAEAAPGLETGYRLSLEQVDEVLGRLGVREVRCDGQPFDAHLMKAVDVAETDQAPEGTVIEVYRAGHERNGELFRLAEVKVARQPTREPEPQSFWARVFRKLAAMFRR